MSDTESDGDVGEGAGEAATILYDIVTYKEWEQEPELLRCEGAKGPGGWRGWRGAGPVSCVPPALEKLRSSSIAWQLAVSADTAGLVAVLGDTWLEVWSSRDNYTQLLGRRAVERDPAPHWRHVTWTRDCQLLGLAASCGQLELCDTAGASIYHVISPRIAASQPGWADTVRCGPIDTTHVGMFFTEVRLPRDGGWVSELLVAEVRGEVTSWLVSGSGYQELSRYSLGWHLTAATLCTRLGLLVTAGQDTCPLAGHRSLVGKASHAGLVTLRLVTQEPHYVPLLDAEEQRLLAASSWTLPRLLPFQSPASSLDHILTMAVSEAGAKLASVHVSGGLSVWRLPSLVLESSSRLGEQPQYDEVNPALLQSGTKRKAKAEFLANPVKYHPVAVAWWTEDNLVVARVSGAVTVLRVSNLDNLLGDSPEFLEGVPRISQCFQKGFFALECELVVRGRRASTREVSAGEDPEEELEVDTDDDDEDSWVGLGKRSAAALAYFVTDSERFAPPKKKSKVVRRTYRLLALVSTSPEELYNRKILLEEYGEAILLAGHYGLDTDSVYRRQWQQSSKSAAAIQDYLTKMRRRTEVIRECLETVPEDIDAARELLKYGLRATDLEALVALNVKDDGVLVLADVEEADAGDKKAASMKRISQVRWESLSLTQKDLIKTRVRLLYYLDCLDTLEDILGGGRLAAERFSPAQFRQLRSHSPLENCARAARRGDTVTVECLLSGRHSSVTAPHWLPVVSAFPETVSPSSYSSLLPCVEGGVVSQLWTQEPRPQDWCEGALAKRWGGAEQQTGEGELYRDEELRAYTASTQLTPGQVSAWYCHRARTCVTVTSLPDTGLELLTLALERGAEVQGELLHNLRTLDCLVYEVQHAAVDLATLEATHTLDTMELLLRGHHTVTGVRRFLQPFLQRLEDARPGEMRRLVGEYCVARAEADLSFPLVVVDNSGPDKTGPVLYSVVDTIRLALDCCYAHHTGNQLELAEKIYLSIIPYFKENPATRQLKYNVSHMKQEVEMFKTHLEISRVLSKNGVIKPLSHIRDNITDSQVMRKLFDAVTARAEAARPPLDQDGWRMVLRDLQLLQSLIPLVEMSSVMLSYTESLLSSGSHSNIELAGSVMEGLLDTEESVQLVLAAWTHYYSTAQDLADPDIELARKCLSLAPEGVKEVQDCYDLIAALQSLADFGLGDVLPVSVLQCKDRMEFVRRAVRARPSAYKNTQRLMKLASLLKVGAGVEGEVWATIARRALELGDVSACGTACNNLMRAQYTRGWDICYALAARSDFGPDLDRCRDLLAFAGSHCEPENIADILNTILTVEQRSITARIQSKIVPEMAQDREEEDEEIFDDAMEEAPDRGHREVSPLASVLHIPSLTSQFVSQHRATPAAVWQLSSSWLHQLARPSSSSGLSLQLPAAQLDTDFTAASLPAFYSSCLAPGAAAPVSQLDAGYTQLARPVLSQHPALVSLHLLRLNFASQTLLCLSDNSVEDQHENMDDDAGCREAITLELLTEVLPLISSQDFVLGLSLLLSASEATSMSSLETLPRTLPSLCYCMAFLAILQLSSKKSTEKMFKSSPRHLVDCALKLSKSKSDPVSAALLRYQDLVTDFNQGNQLSALTGAGEVDVERFTSDLQYKEDTILGLAMFTEQDKWSLTLALARRYSLPLWPVHATHLQTVLTSDLAANEAAELVRTRDLMSVLGEDLGRLEAWLEARVLPLLDGEDTAVLGLYYSLLGPAHQHRVAALTIMEEANINIDFKLLQQGDEEVLKAITSANVETVANVLDVLGNVEMTSSKIYKYWAFETFLRHGKSKDNWIEAFSVCHEYMEKMTAEDVGQFTRSCLLSHNSSQHVPKPARGRIFKKAVKFVEVKIAGKAEGDWKQLQNWLEEVKQHIEKLKTPLALGIIEGFSEAESEHVDEFERTAGDETEIIKLFCDYVVNGVNTELVSNLIRIWKQNGEDLSDGYSELVTAGYMQLLTAVVEQVTAGGAAVTSQPFAFLERACSCQLVAGPQLSSLLTPLCTDETVAVTQRLAIVRSLKTLNLELEADGEEDLDSSMLASLFEIQQEVVKILPEFSVDKADVENNETKWRLFEKMVATCSDPKQLVSIHELIQNWESFETEFAEDQNRNCLLKLSRRLIDIDPGGNDLLNLFKKVETRLDQVFPADIGKVLVQFCETLNNKTIYVKLVLQLRYEDKYQAALEVARCWASCDEDTVLLLVTRAQLPSLVSAGLYPALVASILQLDPAVAQLAADQLQEAGHTAQAAAIQMSLDGFPLGLRTLATVAQRMFFRRE